MTDARKPSSAFASNVYSADAEPAYVAKTLGWCNGRREEQGKPPLKKLPKGKRNDSRSCPCGKATGLVVGWARFFSAQESDLLPLAVQDFVAAFDDGNLPQYEAKS